MKNKSNLQKTRYLKYRKAVPDLLLQQWEAYLFHKHYKKSCLLSGPTAVKQQKKK